MGHISTHRQTCSHTATALLSTNRNANNSNNNTANHKMRNILNMCVSGCVCLFVCVWPIKHYTEIKVQIQTGIFGSEKQLFTLPTIFFSFCSYCDTGCLSEKFLCKFMIRIMCVCVCRRTFALHVVLPFIVLAERRTFTNAVVRN